MSEQPLTEYDVLTLRNNDYIAPQAQAKLRAARILIAGCGIGSSFAVLAARLGCEHFILADGDTIEAHNLNRQFYDRGDVGKMKVSALAAHLKAINPAIDVQEVPEYLNKANIAPLVSASDIVFDTIDFLDLTTIVELHDQCQVQQKPVITALSVGFDAGVIYFPAVKNVTFRQLFDLPASGPVDNIGYTAPFAKAMQRLSSQLEPQVIHAVSKALTIMKDGKPCPAAQVAPGSFAVANLAGTMLYRIFAGLPVTPAPYFLLSRVHQTLSSGGINMLGS